MRKSCICKKIFRTLPLVYTVPCRALNRSKTKRAFAGTPALLLDPITMGGMSHNLQSITPWMEVGNGGPGGPKDGQGPVCCCTSAGQLLRSHGNGHRKAGAWQHWVWGHSWVYAASVSPPRFPPQPGDQGCLGSWGIHTASNGVCLSISSERILPIHLPLCTWILIT